MTQLFEILETGETSEILEGKSIKELMKTTGCYLIIAEDLKSIYLWKGKESNVKVKFIGARKSQDVRNQVGVHFKVVPADESEEDEALLKIMSENPKKGLAKEIKDESPTSAPKHVSMAGLGYVPDVLKKPATPGLKKKKDSPHEVDEPAMDVDKTLELIKTLETPDGYLREMVVIGHDVFGVSESRQSFLGKTIVKSTIEPMGSLPEGSFFAEGFTPRIICENGNVIAIEFLKKS